MYTKSGWDFFSHDSGLGGYPQPQNFSLSSQITNQHLILVEKLVVVAVEARIVFCCCCCLYSRCHRAISSIVMLLITMTIFALFLIYETSRNTSTLRYIVLRFVKNKTTTGTGVKSCTAVLYCRVI
jgi:hypothetical protein